MFYGKLTYSSKVGGNQVKLGDDYFFLQTLRASDIFSVHRVDYDRQIII